MEDKVVSPAGTTFTTEEMAEIEAAHARGEHRQAMFEDCEPCHDELNEAIGWKRED